MPFKYTPLLLTVVAHTLGLLNTAHTVGSDCGYILPDAAVTPSSPK